MRTGTKDMGQGVTEDVVEVQVSIVRAQAKADKLPSRLTGKLTTILADAYAECQRILTELSPKAGKK